MPPTKSQVAAPIHVPHFAALGSFQHQWMRGNEASRNVLLALGQQLVRLLSCMARSGDAPCEMHRHHVLALCQQDVADLVLADGQGIVPVRVARVAVGDLLPDGEAILVGCERLLALAPCQQNITDLSQYSTSVSDLFRSGAEYREERVLIRKEDPEQATSADGLAFFSSQHGGLLQLA